MKKYYKIITDNSHFADEYKIADVMAIPEGTRFRANVPYDATVTIRAGAPVIHFSDNALDTMLWYEILTRPDDKIAIYEVVPLGTVIKQKCPEKYQLDQCGANEIQIGPRLSETAVLGRVKEEFIKKQHPKKNAHPRSPTARIIYQWMHDSKVL